MTTKPTELTLPEGLAEFLDRIEARGIWTLDVRSERLAVASTNAIYRYIHQGDIDMCQSRIKSVLEYFGILMDLMRAGTGDELDGDIPFIFVSALVNAEGVRSLANLTERRHDSGFYQVTEGAADMGTYLYLHVREANPALGDFLECALEPLAGGYVISINGAGMFGQERLPVARMELGDGGAVLVTTWPAGPDKTPATRVVLAEEAAHTLTRWLLGLVSGDKTPSLLG